MIWVENRAPDPIMPPWLWTKRVLVAPYLASMGIGMAMMAPNAFLPFYDPLGPRVHMWIGC